MIVQLVIVDWHQLVLSKFDAPSRICSEPPSLKSGEIEQR